MAYRFKRSDSTVEKGFRRIARVEIEKAIEEIDHTGGNIDEAVHAVRKRCKRLRGLIRLVRPDFDGYRAENAVFRDIARSLAFLRDGAVMIKTYDLLAESYRDQIERTALGSIRRQFTLRQKNAIQHEEEIKLKFAQARAALVKAHGRSRRWKLMQDGFPAISKGLSKTYRRAEKAIAHARKDPTPAAFHEWRKRIKYHGYHTQLVRPLWPEILKAHGNAAERLNDLLGDHHDLSVFRQELGHAPDAFGAQKNIEVMFGLARRRQALLEAEAFALGFRLLAEPADALIARWGDYWTIWRGEKPVRQTALAA